MTWLLSEKAISIIKLFLKKTKFWSESETVACSMGNEYVMTLLLWYNPIFY